MFIKKYSIALILVLLSGCGQPNIPQATRIPVVPVITADAVNIFPSATAPLPTAAPTQPPATMLVATSTAPVEQANAPAPTPLHMQPGATSVNVEGNIAAGQFVDFLVNAAKDQTLIVTVQSPNNDVFVGVSGIQDGQPYLRTAADANEFVGLLPATQDYRIVLQSTQQTTSYTLQVTIPVRIIFKPNTIAASLSGAIIKNNVNHYLLKAMKDQTMSINMTSPSHDVFLTVYGMKDRLPLVRSASDAQQWTGKLPADQDYMIMAVSTGENTTYTLDVTVTSN